ncbi:hypothetical protein [Pseudosulfitobacter pseudonitzschiae]|uniref:hypothetical protein n=1 Tax=Pseudosulfitobacter pseudonitzschiae TaxID=1402135 RepID=UPI001AF6012F|nr:hypothetical protein [Pseudosulfitobacter pseudonitzschiae]MBM1818036.1 hypothetical protein [Pseudosulfitobacter pseudonitzschiae]MBM1835063.1 hypothetical protein [Pseudosulfitobacter pseudonitzschiae]MBM1839895.1 hypothetical protein [Pseudosulfitobacter pseudonitzschiae]MBM1844778.1 hypothetical protein [Pseudosulfitobacter pseudonitzschiae]MBM1849581.1 hypothetical protein [Pseudosulfitobacter pseudonitzschiae]
MKQAILHELMKRGAVSPMEAVAPEVIRESVAAEPAQFATILSELTDFEQVGMIAGEIYLRETSNL